MISTQSLQILRTGCLFGLFLSLPMTSFGMTNAIETPSPVSGHEVSIQSITPADVFARVELLRKELDDLRFEMGKPNIVEIGLLAKDATPHEVFFQANTLDKKVARLTKELTEGSEPLRTEDEPGDIRSFHVWKVVDTALHRILLLKQQLGLSLTNSEPLPDPETTPTQVFFSIGLANSQLNHLLMHQFSPKDVAEQITLGIEYTTHLLRKFSTAPAPAPLPSLDRGRIPWDSYSRLVDCYMVLGDIARASNISMLSLATQNLDRPDIQPNEVYDLATLVNSELAYLHTHLPHTLSPQRVRQPGAIFPSHVYQQAGGLLAQLQELHKQVQANPGWLQ